MQIMGTNPGVAGKAAGWGGGVLVVWLLDHVCGWGLAAPDGAADVPAGTLGRGAGWWGCSIVASPHLLALHGLPGQTS